MPTSTTGRRMRLRTKIGAMMLAGSMLLAAWDCGQGRSLEDGTRRMQSAFIARAALEGCEDPVASTVSVDEKHTTHYGVEYPTARDFAVRYERGLSRWSGTFFERVEVHNAGDVEVLSFPGGGAGCYDNLFVPVVVDYDFGWGLKRSVPTAVRVTQKGFGHMAVPFVGPEITGLYHDDSIPPRRHRGRADATGFVPPAPNP